jgi:hypothetical protein
MSYLINTRTIATVLAVAACTAAGAETAAAADVSIRTDYSVEMTGTGYYNRASVQPSSVGELVHQEDEQFTFRTEIPKVSFIGAVGSDSERSLGSATGVRSHLVVSSGGKVSLECDGSNVTDYAAGRLDAQVPENGNPVFDVRIFETLNVTMNCNLGVGAYPKKYESTGPVGSGWWDTRIQVPRSQVGQEQIVLPLNGGRKGQACHGWNQYTTLCEHSFEGTIVFKKIGWEELPHDPDELLVPLTKPAEPNAPAAAKPIVEAVTTAARLTRTGVSVPVSCPTGCSGTATVTIAGRKARAAAAKALARKTFTVAPGATRAVAVAIPKRARKAVRRAGGVRLTLDVTPTGGTRTTKRLAVRLGRR